MRRLWLLRYGRPLILVTVVIALALLQGVQTLAMHVNLSGINRAPSEILLLFATEPYILFATAATFLALTPIGRDAVTWLSNRTSGRLIGLVVRIPLVALLVALSFSRPDHQYRLVSQAAAGAASPQASRWIIGATLGAAYYWPLSIVLGVSATISGDHFLLVAAAALFTLLVSSGLALTIIALLYQVPQTTNNSPVEPISNDDADWSNAHRLLPFLFWTTLISIAVMFAALPFTTLVSTMTLVGSIIAAICYRVLQPRALLNTAGTYFATLLLYGALIIAGGVISQLLTISGLLQDFAFEYQSGNRIFATLVICGIVFAFSSIFGTLATAISWGSIIIILSTTLLSVSGPWLLVSLLIVLKISATLSPLGFINNAVAADSPMISGYIGRLRILFPVIAADFIVFAFLIAFGSALPQL